MIKPFLCLSIFPLCDNEDNVHTILKETCVELRNRTCAREWIAATALLNSFNLQNLPVCEKLPDVSDECIGKIFINHYKIHFPSLSLLGDNTTSPVTSPVTSPIDVTTLSSENNRSVVTQCGNGTSNSNDCDGETPVCSETFFFDEDTELCRPLCADFNPSSTFVIVLQRVLICIGFIFSIVVLLLAVTTHRDTL